MSSTRLDHDHEYGAAVRAEWTGVAPGWVWWIDTMESDDGGRALTRVLLDLAAVVGTDGHVTCIDISGDTRWLRGRLRCTAVWAAAVKGRVEA